MKKINRGTAVLLALIMCIPVTCAAPAVYAADTGQAKAVSTVTVPLFSVDNTVPARKGIAVFPKSFTVVPVKISKQGSLLVKTNTKNQPITMELYSDSGCKKSVSDVFSMKAEQTKYQRVDKVSSGTYYWKVSNGGTQNADVAFAFCSTSRYPGTLQEGKIMVGSGYGKSLPCYVKFKIKRKCSIYPFIASDYYTEYMGEDEDPIPVFYTIEKYSDKSKKWGAVTGTIETMLEKGGRSLALSKGSYRYCVKSTSPLITFFHNLYVHKQKYQTKKKNAVLVVRKKTADHILTATESTSKAHWYKLKLTKSQKVKVSCSGAVSDGGICIELRTKNGKKIKSRILTKKNTKASYAYYEYGDEEYTDNVYRNSAGSFTTKKLKKGTYYFRVHKTIKKSSGNYAFKWQ